MRRLALSASLVAIVLSQSCSRNTSESAQAAYSLQHTATRDIFIDDSLRFARSYVMLIDSPSLRIIQQDSSSSQIVTLSAHRAAITSCSNVLSSRKSKIATVDSVAADTVRSVTKTRENRLWQLPLLAAVAAGLMLLLSLRGIGSRR